MPEFSYQLYCSRNFPPLADTLKMVAAAGYKNVEGYGALYADKAKVAELNANLGANGLRMPTGHFGIDQLEKDPDRVLEIAKAVGIETIYCPYLPPDQRPDRRQGLARLRPAAAEGRAPPTAPPASASAGTTTTSSSSRPPTASLPQTAIFEGGPDLEWEADIAWVIRGGADPLEWIRTMGKRITAVHVKDIAPAGENKDEDGWADVGHGTVDWKGADGGAQGRTQRPSTSSWSTTTPRTTSASPSARSPPPRSSEGHAHGRETRRRHHRLRQHLRRLLQARAPVQGPRGARLHRHQHGRRRGARQGVRRQGAETDRRPARRTPTSTSSST